MEHIFDYSVCSKRRIFYRGLQDVGHKGVAIVVAKLAFDPHAFHPLICSIYV